MMLTWQCKLLAITGLMVRRSTQSSFNKPTSRPSHLCLRSRFTPEPLATTTIAVVL